MTAKFSLKIAKIILIGLIVMSIISCEKEQVQEEPQVTMSDLLGSWIATSAVFTNNSNSSQKVDFVAVGGKITTTTLLTGTRTWIEFQEMPLDEFDAAWVITGDILTATPVDTNRTVEVYKIEFVNDILTLTNTNAEFDFTLTGAAETSSTSVVTLVRH